MDIPLERVDDIVLADVLGVKRISADPHEPWVA